MNHALVIWLAWTAQGYDVPIECVEALVDLVGEGSANWNNGLFINPDGSLTCIAPSKCYVDPRRPPWWMLFDGDRHPAALNDGSYEAIRALFRTMDGIRSAQKLAVVDAWSGRETRHG